jgi:hypothetical protein
MKESTHIAYSFAKALIAQQFSENQFFEKAKVHLHCPEGAVPKDGKFFFFFFDYLSSLLTLFHQAPPPASPWRAPFCLWH